MGEVRKNPQEPAQTRGSRRKKTNRRPGWFFNMVEPAGIEPASVSPLQKDLHAYPVYFV